MTTRPLKVWDGSSWVNVGVQAPDMSGYVTTGDSRLTDQRVPVDGSVTIAKRQEQYAAISTATTLGATQSVVDVTGTTTVTLPTAASHTGRVYIIRNTGTNTVTVSGITNLTLPGKGTVEVVSNGTAWSVLRGTYTDESVGRRVFTWDAVNSRWQMTYGDTGWRSVSLSTAGATKFPSGEVWIRRVNNLVRARFYAGTGTVTGAGITVVVSLPTGFRPTSLNARGAVGSAIMANSGLPAPHGYYCTDSNLIVACTSSSPDTLHGEVSSETSDAWPTSLPGTAVDSIPS